MESDSIVLLPSSHVAYPMETLTLHRKSCNIPNGDNIRDDYLKHLGRQVQEGWHDFAVIRKASCVYFQQCGNTLA